jgi:hypothetical protein
MWDNRAEAHARRVWQQRRGTEANVGEVRPHACELEEIGQIDYFMEHLARAVERGEVHHASYDLLAPRYLARRADLVSILTGVPAPTGDYWAHEAAAQAQTPSVVPEEQPIDASQPRAAMLAGTGLSQVQIVTPAEAAQPTPAQPAPAGFAAPTPAPQPAWPAPTPRPAQPPRPVVHREPVSWSTVVLFLGAFLVISASAIFALTVWNSVGPLVKLGFLGAATIAFYAAGYFARTKLKLRAGSTALTVVGSAMLVFDCWIVINSYHLTGPLPWAVALLFISAVYWFTEAVFHERIYGIAGAAAQVAWWWLAADGLNLDPIARVAIISVVGVAWQVLAARAIDDETWHSLAEVLLWGAPIVEVLAAPAAAAALLRSGETDIVVVATAAVVSASGAFVALRSALIPQRTRRWIAAALQVPLFIAILLGSGPTWAGVAFLAALATVYTLLALSSCGAAMVLPAVAAEGLMLGSALDLLHVGQRGGTAATAALGVSWLLAAFLIARAAEHPLPAWLSGAEETGAALRVLGFVPLLLASVAAVFVSGPALSGVEIGSRDAALAVIVLAAWVVAAFVPRSPAPALGSAIWSFYTAAAVMSWAAPSWQPTIYATLLIALASLWLLTRDAVERAFRVNADAFGSGMRVLVGVFLLGGLAWQRFVFDPSDSWRMVLPLALAAAAYLADVYLTRAAASALAGAFALALVAAANALYLSDPWVSGALGLFGFVWITVGHGFARDGRWANARTLSASLRWGGFAVLVAASTTVPFIGSGVPLSGVSIASADAVLAASILGFWLASAAYGRDPETASGAAAWSFYVLAAVLAVLAPKLHSAAYASALLALATAWLFARGALQRYCRVNAEQFAWTMRGVMLLAWAAGLAAELYFFDTVTSWASVGLSLLVFLAFLADAAFADEPASAAIAGVALVFAADRYGALILGPGQAALFAGVAAVLAGVIAWAVRGAWSNRSRALAVASAIAVTLACVPHMPKYWLAGALALAAVAWGLAAATAWEPLAFASALAGLASLGALLSAADRPGWITVALFGVAALVLGVPSVLPATRKGGPHEAVGSSLALAGGLAVAWLVPVGYASRYLGNTGWLGIGAQGFAVALLLIGAYAIMQAVVRRIEPMLYAGSLVVLFALFAEFQALQFTTAELFSTPTAFYLVAMGYLYQRWDDGSPRVYPVVLDYAAVLVGLGVPVVLALTNTIGKPMVVHTAWAIGLSLLAIGAGIVVRSRAFLFGGSAALAIVAGWRTLSYLAELWWLVLGIIGVAMLAIALTWERQRQLIGETRARLQDSFENWR